MLCSENGTYIVMRPIQSGVVDISGENQNEIPPFETSHFYPLQVGEFGKYLDRMFVKKSLRKCRLIGSFEIGEKLANSTYTGALGILQSKQADVYLRPVSDYLHEDWLQKSIPVKMEGIIVGQAIRDQDTVSFFNLLDNFKFGFALSVTYLLSFAGILAFFVLFNELTRRIQPDGTPRFAERRTVNIGKRIAVNSFGVKRLPAIGIFVLFVHLFLWITRLLLINNIKTNKVVVDTSGLIKDEHDIFSTQKVACIIKNEQFHSLILSSPANSLLWRIYEKSRLKPDMKSEQALFGADRCLLSNDDKQMNIADSDIFMISLRITANLFLILTQFLNGLFKKIWISEKTIFELNLLYLFVVRKPGLEKKFSKTFLAYSECGVVLKMFQNFENAKEAIRWKSDVILFENVKKFVEEHSGFSDLVLVNFRFVFFYYFLVCSLVFVAFCVTCMRARIKNSSFFRRYKRFKRYKRR